MRLDQLSGALGGLVNRTFSVRFFLLLLLLAVRSPLRISGQTSGVTQSASHATASVALVPGESRVIVTVKNVSVVAVEAWRYQLTYDLGSGPSSMDITVDAGIDPDSSINGAIKA